VPILPFSKFHGFGNDYIVFERASAKGAATLPDLAVAMCDRHTGIGSDGLAVLERLDGSVGDYSCEIVNPDGSFASFSGNGTRCAVAYLYHKEAWPGETLRLKTRSGIKNYKLLGRKGSEFLFEAEIGTPRFHSKDVPVLVGTDREAVVNEPISLAGGQYTFSAVNVGNPVAAIFMDSFDLDWRQMGRELESHAMFPERTNVVFVKVEDRDNIDVRIWERGAGETAASGTCATAAAVLSAFLLKTDREVHVHSPGGTTEVLWRDDDKIVITGSAKFIFSGEWPL
jgi:diaminopimelate epimerase